jgi:hypothetical protein
VQIRSIYQAKALLKAGINGSGQSSAVFELSDYSPTDIEDYVTHYHLGFASSNLVQVDLGTPPVGAELEVELDVELQLALAPNLAHFYIYDAPNTSADRMSEYARIASDNLATTISTSWGICETVLSSTEVQSENQSFQQMAAQGQSIYAASGDDGAYDCPGSPTTLGVHDPASQPYMTGVGGTHLSVDPGTRTSPGYISETVWSCSTCPAGSQGGGGGLSTLWPRPNWQQGPGVKNSYSTGKREVPDVALDADPNTGYSAYCTVTPSCPATGWEQVGGTSAAAPLWAAFTALVNQQRASKGLGALGFAAPALTVVGNASGTGYSKRFHDITSGNNLYYPASKRYDLATGWGSPNMANLLAALSVQTWSVIASPVPTTGQYFASGTAAISAKDVWAVGNISGASPSAPAQTLTEHWNGKSWSVISSPNPAVYVDYLSAVAAVSTDDVWAVGEQESCNGCDDGQMLIEHWDGTSWSVIANPSYPGTGSSLNAVWALSANNVWAVGDYGNSSNSVALALIIHWDGSSWSFVSSPPPSLNVGYLTSVSGTSANDVWAVGIYEPDSCDPTMGCPYLPLIEHWNGTSWSLVSDSFPFTQGQLLGVSAISATNAWAVGYADEHTEPVQQPLIEHWDGTSWSVVSIFNSDGGELLGVLAVSATNVWAVGNSSGTLVEYWNGTSWSVASSPTPYTNDPFLYAVSATAANDVWAIGCCNSSNGQMLIEHWIG